MGAAGTLLKYGAAKGAFKFLTAPVRWALRPFKTLLGLGAVAGAGYLAKKGDDAAGSPVQNWLTGKFAAATGIDPNAINEAKKTLGEAWETTKDFLGKAKDFLTDWSLPFGIGAFVYGVFNLGSTIGKAALAFGAVLLGYSIYAGKLSVEKIKEGLNGVKNYVFGPSAPESQMASTPAGPEVKAEAAPAKKVTATVAQRSNKKGGLDNKKSGTVVAAFSKQEGLDRAAENNASIVRIAQEELEEMLPVEAETLEQDSLS